MDRNKVEEVGFQTVYGDLKKLNKLFSEITNQMSSEGRKRVAETLNSLRETYSAIFEQTLEVAYESKVSHDKEMMRRRKEVFARSDELQYRTTKLEKQIRNLRAAYRATDSIIQTARLNEQRLQEEIEFLRALMLSEKGKSSEMTDHDSKSKQDAQAIAFNPSAIEHELTSITQEMSSVISAFEVEERQRGSLMRLIGNIDKHMPSKEVDSVQQPAEADPVSNPHRRRKKPVIMKECGVQTDERGTVQSLMLVTDENDMEWVDKLGRIFQLTVHSPTPTQLQLLQQQQSPPISATPPINNYQSTPPTPSRRNSILRQTFNKPPRSQSNKPEDSAIAEFLGSQSIPAPIRRFFAGYRRYSFLSTSLLSMECLSLGFILMRCDLVKQAVEAFRVSTKIDNSLLNSLPLITADCSASFPVFVIEQIILANGITQEAQDTLAALTSAVIQYSMSSKSLKLFGHLFQIVAPVYDDSMLQLLCWVIKFLWSQENPPMMRNSETNCNLYVDKKHAIQCSRKIFQAFADDSVIKNRSGAIILKLANIPGLSIDGSELIDMFDFLNDICEHWKVINERRRQNLESLLGLLKNNSTFEHFEEVLGDVKGLPPSLSTRPGLLRLYRESLWAATSSSGSDGEVFRTGLMPNFVLEALIASGLLDYIPPK